VEQRRDLAITLRWVPYEERHRVVTALTEQHGKISALARNSIQSRRFGGSLEPFAAAEWRFVERGGSADLYRLEEAQIRRGYEGLRADFGKLSLASVFNELMLRVAPEREPCPDLFRLHANALALVEELPAEHASGHGPLLNGYLAKVLQWSGSQPQIHACSECGCSLDSLAPDAQLSALVESAAWLCPRCRREGSIHIQGGGDFSARALRVSALSMMDLLLSLSTPIRSIPQAARAGRTEHEVLFRFIESLLVYHLPGFDRASLKSLRFLETSNSSQP